MEKTSKILKRRQLNNKGMSLVEVLVAIVILAIVTGPVLKTFVSAIQFNVRAKEQQRLNTAVQSIMEGFKAYDIEELCFQFSSDALHPFNVIGNYGSYQELAAGTDGGISISSPDGGVTNVFTPDSDNKYAFSIENVSYENADGSTTYYDAKIEVSSKTASSPTDINGVWNDVANVVDMNEYLDAVYKQPNNQDTTMYGEIQQMIVDELNDQDKRDDKVFTLNDLEDPSGSIKVEKVTTIAVTMPDASNTAINVVTVTTEYKYDISGYEYVDDAGNTQAYAKTGSIFYNPSAPNEEIYNNTNTCSGGAKLENIYYYYYPAYQSATGIEKETILIQNGSDSAKNVYLVKQINTSLTTVDLNTCENSYDLVVSGSGSGINLYHNLNTNLSGLTSSPKVPSISGVYDIGKLFASKNETLLFDVKVSIYEAGAASEGYPDSRCLMELDGSMDE